MRAEQRQRLRYVLADYVSTTVALLVYDVIRYYLLAGLPTSPLHGLTLGEFLGMPMVVLELVLFPPLMLGVYWLSGYYASVFFKSRLQELMVTATTALAGTVILFFGVMVNDIVPQRRFVLELIATLYGCMFVTVYIPRLLLTLAGTRAITRGRWAYNTLIVGTSAAARRLEERLRSTRNRMAMRPVAFIDPDGPGGVLGGAGAGELPLPVYGLDDVERVCRELDVKRLVVAPHRHGMRATTDLIGRLFPLELPIYISADVNQLLTSRPRLLNVASEPLVEITSSCMSAATLNLKRASDVVVSALALVAIAPLLGVLAVLIKRDSRGPVFYRQERIGYHKKPFTIYKLRTMTTDAESTGPALSTVDDPRITPLGRVLRKYRLDELPQFWNVLRGDMSLVGPRPEREYYIRQIVARAPHYTLVHRVRPGITSWGMVKYGYASDVDQMVERLSYDLLYIENVSMVIDLKILIYTVRTVLTGRGI